MCVRRKQTAGWRLSAATVLLVKFLCCLPVLGCHSSSEMRKENECSSGVGELEKNRAGIQLIFSAFFDKKKKNMRKETEIDDKCSGVNAKKQSVSETE